MNRVVALEQARAEVLAAQDRCRVSYDHATGGRMDHILWSCWDFHGQCQRLREAEEKLRLLQFRGQAANDTRLPDVFDMNYPKPVTTGDLMAALDLALPAIDRQRLRVDTVYEWPPRSDVFAEVAHWVRIENAWRSHQLRLPTPGMDLPPRFPMPPALERALSVKLEPIKKTRTRKAAP